MLPPPKNDEETMLRGREGLSFKTDERADVIAPLGTVEGPGIWEEACPEREDTDATTPLDAVDSLV